MASELPSFPCWCRATYSWGGETKKDLGFIEGDLIEALNAGDGLWWMGRLRRDPRAVGLFPSNFVAVLDPLFTPAPNASRGGTPTPTPPPASKTGVNGQQSGMFRKPFQAYGSVGKRGANDSREETPDSEREKEKARRSKFRPYASMKTAQAPTSTLKRTAQQQGGSGVPEAEKENAFRVPSPPPRAGHRSRRESPVTSATATPQRHGSGLANSRDAPTPSRLGYQAASRPHSPLPSTYHDGSAYPQMLPSSRQPSPQPERMSSYREHSNGGDQDRPGYAYEASTAPSPAFDDYDDEDDLGSSPPPPPPPAHRIAYQPSRPASPRPPQDYDEEHYHHHDRARTPEPPPSPGPSGMTPSPLRDAMNDVMSSLHDMSVVQDSQPSPARHSETPVDPWSPDAYDLVRRKSQSQARAHSAMGFAGHYERRGYGERDDGTPSLPSSRDGPPRLDNYVHRMEHQLQHSNSATSYLADLPPAPPLKDSHYSRPNTSSSNSSVESSQFYHKHQPKALNHRKSAYELGASRLNRTYTTKTNVTNSTESSSATQSSTSTALTSRSIMSGHSAGAFSATSAGSLARRKFGLGSQRSRRGLSVIDTRSQPDIGSSARSMVASETSGSGPSYHDSHSSRNQPTPIPTADWMRDPIESGGVLGGLSAPSAKTKKSGFLRKMIDSAKTTAKTGAANARSTIGSRPGSSRSGSVSPTKSLSGGIGNGGFGGNIRPGSSGGGDAARDMGLGGGAGNEWMQVRRDVNRSNSLSRRERDERAERCELLDLPVLDPIDQLHELTEGDEGLDGLPITEPTDFNIPNLALVDKSTRFIQSVPGAIGAAALAQSYICRPHRTDVQRLRAIFTWVSERVTWEEDFEGEVDIRRVVQTRRGSSEEIAVLVRDMCNAVGLHAEVVRGYLKAPGEVVDLDMLARPNHWWNAVIVDGEWRVLDCSLASPTHPRRSAYSSAGSQIAESWYFLARPLEICYTHIPLLPEQQHIAPPVPHELLIALPCACPAYFRNGIELADFDTSALHLEQLEMAHLHVAVPEDVECVAVVEARSFARDIDGDVFESGDLVVKPALAQPEWPVNGNSANSSSSSGGAAGRKRFTIKALLPGDEGNGTLKIYTGKRGLMHSVKDNPHPLALALPLSHTGANPPYDFLVRHPTPHAQRHDLYVAQPQCKRLGLNNTFVFTVRQHPSSLSRFTPDVCGPAGGNGNNGSFSASSRPGSPNPFARPTSAMSMVSASVSQASGSQYSSVPSDSGIGMGSNGATAGGAGGAMTAAQQKPAKLAIQSPSQRITRLTRKAEHGNGSSGAGSRRTLGAIEGGGPALLDGDADGATGAASQGAWTSTWETVIKVGERGTWRGLVLADRSARWCVFAEWECV